jgi:hypothetical protein
MLDKDVEIDMKVVPFTKSWRRISLDQSIMWNDNGGKEQGYLYVHKFDNEEGLWVLNSVINGNGGDYFLASEFYPYVSVELIESQKETVKDFHPYHIEIDPMGKITFK